MRRLLSQQQIEQKNDVDHLFGFAADAQDLIAHPDVIATVTERWKIEEVVVPTEHKLPVSLDNRVFPTTEYDPIPPAKSVVTVVRYAVAPLPVARVDTLFGKPRRYASR